MSRAWPCSTFTKEELDAFGGSAWKLYLSDPNRIELGEVLFTPLAKYIPPSVHPNTLTRYSITFNILLVIVAFLIPVTVPINGVLPAILCLVCCVFNTIVGALDCFDGIHARGTKQCSALGELLDHWFDSASTVMNAAAMCLIFDGEPLYNIIGVMNAAMVFNMQLLLSYYNKTWPRVAGIEAQLGCSLIDVVMASIFYFEWFHVVEAIALGSSILSCFVISWYLYQFLPQFNTSITWIQWAIFTGSYVLFAIIYYFSHISTFEFLVFSIFISWDFNGTIVMHVVRKTKLPRLHFYYFISCFIIYLENKYVPFTGNKLHFTTICAWIIFSVRNINSFLKVKAKLPKEKKLNSKNVKKQK